MHRHQLLPIAMLVVAGAVGACRDQTEQPAGTATPATDVTSTIAADTVPASTVPGATVPAPTDPVDVVEIAAVHHDFGYYGACGNETVLVDGTMFYPVLPEDRDAIDETRYPVEAPISSVAGLARVGPPGPGDDVGTMIVYTDGLARFQSDSGTVHWLTSAEQIYNWVC